MYDTVHVDEKLFYMTQVRRSFCLLPGEPKPERSVRSKRYITKMIMLAAVARPRWVSSGSTFFDGKLGIWAFVVREPALRSSHRRPAGTMETKEGRVNKETYRAMLIERLLPALREGMPHAAEVEKRPGLAHRRRAYALLEVGVAGTQLSDQIAVAAPVILAVGARTDFAAPLSRGLVVIVEESYEEVAGDLLV
ncbi:hypothetical protein PC116_g14057 [Phytophthora cactorum]|nr:hypothetical protein PC121_g11149 [Phytophthora cactorum]KAG4237881.1 hypothetical protein PC116_g14057 [Phytophthora cactorum]